MHYIAQVSLMGNSVKQNNVTHTLKYMPDTHIAYNLQFYLHLSLLAKVFDLCLPLQGHFGITFKTNLKQI